MYKSLVIIITGLLLTLSAQAQKVKVDNSTSMLTVSGTSSLHDWTITASNMQGEATIRQSEASVEIPELTFTLPAKGLESGKGGMDDNTYKALKAKKHPSITYTLTKVNEVEKRDFGYLLNTTGTLSIAGKEKQVNMQVKLSLQKGIIFSGKVPMKMTDFDIDPPTALLGTIKTGDEVEVIFNVRYQ